MYREMDHTKAFEIAKVVLQDTFGPEGYRSCRLEGWEDSNDCWFVLLSMEYIPAEGSAGHTMSQLIGGRRVYRKVAVGKTSEVVQSVQPVPNPYAVVQSTDT